MAARPRVSERAEAMAARLADEMRRRGLAPDAVARVDRAFRLAMRPRVQRLADDHHPDFLHPGRTGLVLLKDAGVTDPVVLATGVLCETVRADLAPEADAVRAELGADVAALLDAVPTPSESGDMLLELLVTAEEPVRLVALAERLDHARHLHLRNAEEWAPFHTETCTVYRPVAARTHPTLSRRFDWWCRRSPARGGA